MDKLDNPKPDIRDLKIKEIYQNLKDLLPDILSGDRGNKIGISIPTISETIEEDGPLSLKTKLIESRKRRVKFIVSISLILVLLARVDWKITSYGTVVPKQRFKVRSVSNGILERVFFAEGDLVKKGQVVAMLSQQDIVSNIRIVKTKIAMSKEHINETRLESDWLKSDLDRKTELVEENALPVIQKEKADYEYKISLSQFEQSKKELEFLLFEKQTLEQKLLETNLLSPIDGKILTWGLHNYENQFITQGEIICEIGTGDKVIETMVKEKDVDNLNLHSNAIVTFDSYPKNVYPARVAKIASMVGEVQKDPWTKEEAYAVEIELKREPEGLSLGMHARVDIDARKRRIIEILLSPMTNFAKRQWVKWTIENGQERPK